MSTIQRAYKTELALNNRQITACKRHAGAARWAYNWGLQRKQAAYEATGTSPSAVELHRELNALKPTELPWLYDVSKCAPQEALRHLDAAFAHFFRPCALKKAGKWTGTVGYPQPKTRKHGLGSFRLTGSIVVLPEAIQLPRLGRLRLTEHGYLPVAGVQVLSATVSEQAGHWLVSAQVQQDHAAVMPTATTAHATTATAGAAGPVVGVDLGITTLATCSDGTVCANPHHLKQRLQTIRRQHRVVSRRRKGSQHRQQAVRMLGTLARRVANQRKHTLQQLTTRLANTKAVIVIEELHVAGMLKNHRLAQAIADVGFSECRRQLCYKAEWYGSQVVVADRWYPSSKMCSGCGWVDAELTLADRVFRCRTPEQPACAVVLDRDLNAALKLAKLAGSSSERQNACGAGSAGLSQTAPVDLPVRMQEPDAFDTSVLER